MCSRGSSFKKLCSIGDRERGGSWGKPYSGEDYFVWLGFGFCIIVETLQHIYVIMGMILQIESAG